MVKHFTVGSTATKDILLHDYESVLYAAATELSEKEYKHLSDIANIGYHHATEKDTYIEDLTYTITEWLTAARRKEFFIVPDSTEFDLNYWYNNTSEVSKQMKEDHKHNVVPAFFVYFGAVVLALFCISATIFAVGIYQHSFPINPVYLFMFAVGFLGLLLTDIVAIAEWKKVRNEQK